MRHFHYKSLEEIARAAAEHGATHVRFEPSPERVREAFRRPVQAGPFRIGNALCIHPIEGCDCDLDGRPGELTRRRYERFGRGGAKLVWFEACAVAPEGRANPRQMWLNEATLGDIAALLERTRQVHRDEWGSEQDLLEPLQLTHSGRYSVGGRTIAYHHPLIDQRAATPADLPPVTDDELDRLQDRYIETARLAVKAGFRCLDVKATHGYLLSELMGAKTRPGKYGGSIENRSRFVCDVLRRLRDEFGPPVILTVRLGCHDNVVFVKDPKTGEGVATPYPVPYPWGFGVNPENPVEPDLTDVKQAIALFRGAGMQLLNVSLGSPYYNPHIGRPFETPDEGNYEQPEHPLTGVNRHFKIAGELQRAFPDLPMVGTGYSWLQRYAANAGAANLLDGSIAMMGMGRNALANPDFARDILEHGALIERKVCKTLTYCTYLMRRKDHPLGQYPTGCPPFDKEAYGPIMKEARKAARERNA